MNPRIVIYAVISLLALYFTWSNNIAFLTAHPDAGLVGFVEAAMVNGASRSLTWDLSFLLASCFVFMWVEARKHGIRFVGLYYLFSFLVAIAVVFPLFLIARELRMGAAASS